MGFSKHLQRHVQQRTAALYEESQGGSTSTRSNGVRAGTIRIRRWHMLHCRWSKDRRPAAERYGSSMTSRFRRVAGVDNIAKTLERLFDYYMNECSLRSSTR